MIECGPRRHNRQNHRKRRRQFPTPFVGLNPVVVHGVDAAATLAAGAAAGTLSAPGPWVRFRLELNWVFVVVVVVAVVVVVD